MSSQKDKPFDKLYAQVEDIPDGRGGKMNTVLFSKNGDYSVIMEIENPVQQYCTDAAQYYAYCDVLNNIIQTLGEGFCLQKQDVFCRQQYNHSVGQDEDLMYQSYFKYFHGREYTEIRTYIIISQEAPHGTFVKYDPKKWLDFHLKISKVCDILKDRGMWYHKLDQSEVVEYVHRFLSFNFRRGPFSLDNMKVTDEFLKMGNRAVKNMSLIDIDTIDLPQLIRPYTTQSVNGFNMAVDLLSFLSDIPNADCVVYNQVLQIPPQRALQRKLQGKAKRHDSMPDPSNKIARADIDSVLNILAQESRMLVWVNYNIIFSAPLEKIHGVASYIETKLYDSGILPSKSCYNQLELFMDSFPGLGYNFNKDYDLFLTLSDAALCLFYKEHMKHSEEANLNVWYCDRQGIPISIDITGKEGKIRYTDNANFFCLGPSGSGKSFNMNSIVAQLMLQDTDVVLVDTGDSYEGISRYFGGKYITYSKESPISMNPFVVTKREYDENFTEKKDFLKSLIFIIFKGDELPSKMEDDIINQTIVEYYDAFFHPFTGYTDDEREELRATLFLQSKVNGDYDKYKEKIEEKYSDDYTIDELERGKGDSSTDDQREEDEEDSESFQKKGDVDDIEFTDEEKKHHATVQRKVSKLQDLINDKAASEGEKDNANRALSRLMPELMEGRYLQVIDKKIDEMEQQRKSVHIDKLCFNTYYEYAVERIPQIMKQDGVKFPIRDFAKLLRSFYKGGEMEDTLNNDLDKTLFDEKFIVFEIDKIKDNKLLFSIVVLIIMDVFIQKMRLKKGRKALIIEEAWKAISSPTMAGYIKYLYKTVRKFNGIAGVVTQELNDVIDSPIVKEAIINNSDVKILLDQAKFKDRYGEISSILGLTDVQRMQIFTINALPPREGIPYHKEVWIARGQYSDVYSVEVPPEWYWLFTTERVEKEAFKVYERHYGSIRKGLVHIEEDRKKKGVKKYFDFATIINRHESVMSLWKD